MASHSRGVIFIRESLPLAPTDALALVMAIWLAFLISFLSIPGLSCIFALTWELAIAWALLCLGASFSAIFNLALRESTSFWYVAFADAEYLISPVDKYSFLARLANAFILLP